ncbi:MAG TPA: hypothetical protein VK571_09985 [Gemmatimonadaceae bacterium]|nr:hypothetical protein [Gemmatimonadaceae bacterium]
MHFTRIAGHHRRALAATIIGLSALGTVACSPDAATTPLAPNEISAARVTAPATGSEQQLARSLALGLQDPAVRGQVRDAMRASLVDEHKLVLQTFAQTASGKALVQSAARKSGVSVKSIETQIAALPALDFYMPIRAHRQSWQGTDNVVVLATLDRKGPFVAYATTGTAVSLAGKTRDQLAPLFILHPVEPAGRRVHPQAATPGSVIEDPNDGQGSESVTWYPAGGTPITIDLADPNPQQEFAKLSAMLTAEGKTSTGAELVVPNNICTCEDCPWQEGCGPPPPPPQPTDTTLIRDFHMNQCDDEECWTNLEIRITAVYRNAAGVEIARAVYRRGDVNPHSTYYVNVPLIFQRIQEGSGQYMQMNLVEEDGFGQNDDWCGDINVFAADREQLIPYPNTSQCYSDPPGGTPVNAWIRYGWSIKY